MHHAPFLLRLPAELEQVALLEDAIEAWASAHHLPPAVASRLQLVAEEITANVAMHGKGASFFELRVTRMGEALHLALLDDGPSYDPLTRAAPNTEGTLEERDAGGLGVHLVRTLTRDARYERAGDTNRLTCTLPLAA